MSDEKQFRERAKTELRQLGKQLLALATDRDVYWRFEREIVQPNAQLCDRRSPFLDMLRSSYTEAMTARVLRLLDGEESGVSLSRVLAEFAVRPEVLHDKLTQREFARDQTALEQIVGKLRGVAAPHAGHHERTLPALAAAHRELDAAIDLMTATVKTYYWIAADSYLDLEVKYSEDPLAIFSFPWATPVLRS